MIYLHVYSGLTSRCNTIAQAYQLAKKYNEKLIIFWEIQTDCNISYKDVFDARQFNDIKHKVVEYNAVLPGEPLERHISMLRRWLMRKMFLCFIKMRRGVCVDYAPPAEMDWIGKDMQERVVRCGKKVINTLKQKRSIFISAFNGLGIDEIPLTCCRKIIFKQKFVKRAEAMIDRRRMWIGVHIRRTDHQIATEYSTLDVFVERMKKMEQEYHSVYFWLATDDRRVENRVRKVFKDHVCVLRAKRWGRDSREAMECAVIDCLCLSKCNMILGSFGSSYSGFAARYGNKKLITINKNNF